MSQPKKKERPWDNSREGVELPVRGLVCQSVFSSVCLLTYYYRFILVNIKCDKASSSQSYRSVCLQIWLSVCLLTVCLSALCLSAGLSARLSEYLSVYLYIWPLCLFFRLSICLTICLAESLSTCLSVCLFVHLELRWSGLRKSSLCLPVSPCICRSFCQPRTISICRFVDQSVSGCLFFQFFFFSCFVRHLNKLFMSVSVSRESLVSLGRKS